MTTDSSRHEVTRGYVNLHHEVKQLYRVCRTDVRVLGKINVFIIYKFVPFKCRVK